MEDEETLWRDVTRKQGCGAKVKRPHNKRMHPTRLSPLEVDGHTRFHGVLCKSRILTQLPGP
jgi:hypothetical protein